jgi:hypothetical protein
VLDCCRENTIKTVALLLPQCFQSANENETQFIMRLISY